MSSYYALLVMVFFAQQLTCGASLSGKYSKHDKHELLKEILGRYFLHKDNYLGRQRKIAFSAILTQNIDNMKADQPIKFDKVLTNVGSGYDPSTGIFTVPDPGIYVFSWTFMTRSHQHAHVVLHKNRKVVLWTYADDKGTEVETSGATVTLNLLRGDKIQLRSGSKGGYLYNSYCGFTGYYLY